MPFIVNRHESIQYDGTNGTAVAAWIHDSTLVSDNGTTLVVNVYDQGNMYYTANDTWAVRGFTGAGVTVWAGQFTDAEYQNIYVEL